MRRSGSSSCMLRPKSEVNLTQLAEEPPLSVTLINTQVLPRYSTERFYMLSELQIKAESMLFLCDHHHPHDDDCDETVESSEASLAEPPLTPPSGVGIGMMHAESPPPPSPVLLYVMWRPHETSSNPCTFADETIHGLVMRLKHHLETTSTSSSAEGVESKLSSLADDSTTPTTSTSTTNMNTSPIYVVVDTVVPGCSDEGPQDYDDVDDDAARQRRFQCHVNVAERLARHVAQSPGLRNDIQGITVGVADHVRAAPGLEACLEAVEVGAQVRRRLRRNNITNQKSLLQLAAQHPDDLLGLQEEHVTDAAQGVRQCRVCAEWNGNGNSQSFARRAHAVWCHQHGVLEDSQGQQQSSMTMSKKRKSSKHKVLDELDRDFPSGMPDPISSMMILMVLVYVMLSVWSMYGEEITRYTQHWMQTDHGRDALNCSGG